MNEWILSKLSELLNYPVTDKMICFIHQMPNDRDLDNYMKSVLELSNPTHKEFLLELKKKRAQDAVMTGYRKSNDNNHDMVKFRDKKKNKGKELKTKNSEDFSHQEKEEKLNDKKTKFNKFYSEKNSSVLLNRRNKCDCEARIHELINNCLKCGKIICKQEGIGPCFFCSEPVQSVSATFAEKNCQSNLSKNTITDQRVNNSLLEERNKLLEYDRDSTKRNQVIDDECDYYTMGHNSWLSKSERQKMIQKDEELSEIKFSSHKKKNVTLDLNNMSFFEEDESSDQILNLETTTTEIDNKRESNIPELQYPDVNISQLKYIHQGLPKLCSKNSNDSKIHRVQDKELIEMVDEGFCMTVHEPYASLLITGTNLHLGKSWYSSHRGRLWIHAVSKKSLSTETLSKEYKFKSSEKHHENSLNSNLLLGFVTVVDVLSQDEYQIKYPEYDLYSPYVFICADPYEVSLKIRIQEKPKIYKLDKKIHQAAMKLTKQDNK